MTIEELKTDINRLERKVDFPKKDGWDKLQAISTLLGSLLVPVALGIAGFHISTTLTTQQMHSSDIQATNNVRLAQYQIIAGLMKSLLSADPNERKQAIRFVFVVMRDNESQAREIVYRLSKFDDDPGVRACAADAMDGRVSELTADALGSNPQLSQTAVYQLTNAWRSDSRVTTNILTGIEKGGTNQALVANGIDVLASLDTTQLRPHSNDVASLIRAVPADAPRLQRGVSEIKTKLQYRD